MQSAFHSLFMYLSIGECMVVMFAESPFANKAKPLLVSLEPHG